MTRGARPETERKTVAGQIGERMGGHRHQERVARLERDDCRRDARVGGGEAQGGRLGHGIQAIDLGNPHPFETLGLTKGGELSRLGDGSPADGQANTPAVPV